jgi:hypothetical protein
MRFRRRAVLDKGLSSEACIASGPESTNISKTSSGFASLRTRVSAPKQRKACFMSYGGIYSHGRRRRFSIICCLSEIARYGLQGTITATRLGPPVLSPFGPAISRLEDIEAHARTSAIYVRKRIALFGSVSTLGSRPLLVDQHASCLQNPGKSEIVLKIRATSFCPPKGSFRRCRGHWARPERDRLGANGAT